MKESELIEKIVKIETTQNHVLSHLDEFAKKFEHFDEEMKKMNKEITKMTIKQGFIIMAIVWSLQILQKWLFGV